MIHGSTYDLRVLGYTVIHQKSNNNEIFLESKVNVNGHQIGPVVLEDGVNLLSKWLLNPYAFRTLSAKNKNFIFSNINYRAFICDNNCEIESFIKNAYY